jgi:hypothetical protein
MVLVIAILVSYGCVNMSRGDRESYREIQGLGLDTDVGRIKSPLTAALLNLLPGIGNFYLAGGTDQGSQWVYGILNLLFWPLSVVWAVPEAAIDAETINKLETIYYYRYDPQGKTQYEAKSRKRW